MSWLLSRSATPSPAPGQAQLTLQQLGFEDFVAEVEDSNKDFKQIQKVSSAAPTEWH
jgi:hypothetical protein